MLLELIFVLEVIAAPRLHADRFLPPTPIRVVVTHKLADVSEACKDAAWPGNVRELSNFVKRFLILGDEDMVLAELVRSDAEAAGPVGDLKDVARDAKSDAEADAILRTLQQNGWNKKRAATALKISYKALLYKIQEYGIKPPASRAVKFQA